MAKLNSFLAPSIPASTEIRKKKIKALIFLFNMFEATRASFRKER